MEMEYLREQGGMEGLVDMVCKKKDRRIDYHKKLFRSGWQGGCEAAVNG